MQLYCTGPRATILLELLHRKNNIIIIIGDIGLKRTLTDDLGSEHHRAVDVVQYVHVEVSRRHVTRVALLVSLDSLGGRRPQVELVHPVL